MTRYTIRPATLSDLPALYTLRTEAEQWLAKAGVTQWTPEWHDRARQLIRKNVEDGESWVICDDGQIASTCRIAGPDLDFWNDADHLDDADHLYKLIVARSHAGTGLGDAIIDWACDRAQARGRTWLRIDIWRTNNGLRRYYEKRGFRYVRTAIVPGRNSGLLLQRPVELRTAPANIRLVDDGDDKGGETILPLQAAAR
ncbi:GNAT family N-acetyltransferase [Microbispora sp. NPDC049125]|uniref:GNAT family N-acetyltransferase n=1 Tax=Microbispora sp. NPDC049125 TaxID=3154929 RepID=UPI003467D26A